MVFCVWGFFVVGFSSSLLIWMYEHGCMDTCAVLGVLYACVLH